jgi:Patatin-like phospholipase
MRYRPLPPDRMPGELAQSEADMIKIRREKAGIPPPHPRVGLALSGGGIRSATFSLGVLQGLAQLKLLKNVDYLSTVSGGGYTGSFLGGLFCRKGPSEPSAAEVEAQLGSANRSAGPVASAFAWLRDNGRYLTPGGSGDSLLMVGTVLRNWVAVQVVLGLVFLAGCMALDGLFRAVTGGLPERLVQGGLYLSSWFALALAVLVSGGLVIGWAHWLVDQSPVQGRKGMIARPKWVLIFALMGVAVLLAMGATYQTLNPKEWRSGLEFLLGAGGLALLISWVASHKGPAEARRLLSRALRMVLLASLALAVVALVDSVGWAIWKSWFKESDSSGAGGKLLPAVWRWLEQTALALLSPKGIPLLVLSFAVSFQEKLTKLLGSKGSDGVPQAMGKVLGKALVGLLAMGVAVLWLGVFSALAHRLTFGPVPSAGWTRVALPSAQEWLLAFAALLLLNVLLGRVIGFLNLSTLGPFYTSAITRAYLGASNKERREGDVSPDRRESDDIPWEDYKPWLRGGPLHLINVTLNETTGGRSQVTQKDRKGLGLAVGPAGLSLGIQHHALQEAPEPTRQRLAPLNSFHAFSGSLAQDKPIFRPEALTVGQWVGVSGAAFTTGLGSRTNLSLSILLGFLNVRLGYWWWTGLAPSRRTVTRQGKETPAVSRLDRLRLAFEAAVPVHAHLLGEWFARFPGTASRHWYLSDGGHYENTGLLELIRRQLPLIIGCDNGQDPERKLGDLSNLVAKARVDLGVEITYLDQAGLDRVLGAKHSPAFGSVEALVDPKAPALAALAELHYPGQAQPGLLVILKPTLGSGLPLDLLAYAESNPEFPQQTTMDQFFDETQWEAYRALGQVIVQETIGRHPELFAPTGPAHP